MKQSKINDLIATSFIFDNNHVILKGIDSKQTTENVKE